MIRYCEHTLIWVFFIDFYIAKQFSYDHGYFSADSYGIYM